jgi:hypothetical protein
MKVVTYATHSEGSFEELTHNKFGVEVKVLGMGTTWKGFMDKIHGVLGYLQTLPDDELVVFVDGFDSYILKPLDGLEDAFRSMDCDILLSNNVTIQPKYVIDKIFGICKDGKGSNSGLYMGRCSHLKNFLYSVSKQTSSDDQRNFNSSCKDFPRLKIDVGTVIFKNIPPSEKVEKLYESDAYFGQTPGVFTFSRRVRAIKEYAPFFIPEIILLVLIVYFLYLHFIRRSR